MSRKRRRSKKKVVSGIYRIISPTGKIYIGKSIDIYERWEDYYKLHCANQPKLYNSFKKYGYKNHKFKIVEECEYSILKERECYYQIRYNTLGKNGLNCVIESIKGKRFCDITRKRISKGLSNHYRFNKKKSFKHSEETKALIKKKALSRFSVKCNHPMMGKSHSDISRQKMSESAKIRSKKFLNGRSKCCLNTFTGIYYDSISEAAQSIGMKPQALRERLYGGIINKTDFVKIEN